uniref:DnaJ homolog subfamily C member 1 n=1 Tax=Haemonchus contortus TaxID=6289 RepID=W6NA64_HAECO
MHRLRKSKGPTGSSALNGILIETAHLMLPISLDSDSVDRDCATVPVWIAAIYEVLKSTELREKYNNVLEFGLPDWRQPVFYYRKMRKLSWYEALLVLIGVSSIAHYLMMWAAYYEKYLVLSQSIKKSRKREKKSEPDVSATQLREALEIYRPQTYNLLPFLIVRGSWSTFMFLIAVAKEYMTRREVPDEEEVVETRKPSTTPRAPAPVFNYEVATDLKPVSTNNPESYAKYMSEQLESNKKHSGAMWTGEELYQLVRLSTEKFPPVCGFFSALRIDGNAWLEYLIAALRT